MQIEKIKIGDNNPFVLIAGPCVVENEEITFRTAKAIKEPNLVFHLSLKQVTRKRTAQVLILS